MASNCLASLEVLKRTRFHVVVFYYNIVAYIFCIGRSNVSDASFFCMFLILLISLALISVYFQSSAPFYRYSKDFYPCFGYNLVQCYLPECKQVCLFFFRVSIYKLLLIFIPKIQLINA